MTGVGRGDVSVDQYHYDFSAHQADTIGSDGGQSLKWCSLPEHFEI